jgi:hypothetical protein
MAVKAVEMVRKIRDQLYEEMKDLSLEEQKEMVERESEALQKWLRKKHWPRKDKTIAKSLPPKKVRGKGSIDAVQMVRKIRDKHYQQLKDLSIEEQLDFYRKESQKFQAWMQKETKRKPRSAAKTK